MAGGEVVGGAEDGKWSGPLPSFTFFFFFFFFLTNAPKRERLL